MSPNADIGKQGRFVSGPQCTARSNRYNECVAGTFLNKSCPRNQITQLKRPLGRGAFLLRRLGRAKRDIANSIIPSWA
jgi:hypothetical protein